MRRRHFCAAVVVVAFDCSVNLLEESKRKRRKTEEFGTAVFAKCVSDRKENDSTIDCWELFCGLRDDPERAADLLRVPFGKVWKGRFDRRFELTSDVKRWDSIITLLAKRRK